MEGFIAILAFGAIYLLVSMSAVKKARKAGTGTPHHENFPFPTLEDMERELTNWREEDKAHQERTDELIVPESYIPAAADEMRIEEVEPTTISKTEDQSATNNSRIKTKKGSLIKDFNLRDAVIYSEIMKPKFQSYQ